MQYTYKDIINFWFSELTPADWFAQRDELDATITERFTAIHHAACAGELWLWRATPEGSLAEVIVLDQFSRNIYRGSAQAFAADAVALVLAQNAIANGFDAQLPDERRQFLYLPYMHSESTVIQQESLRLFTLLGNEDNLKYAQIHKDIIDQFGRYPHRNQQLGRTSTQAEQEYLASNTFGFFKS